MYRAAATPLQAGFDFAGEAEKAARSVFVGNIPYEATEEQLKDIFSEVGVVVSFRLVYDRESGKPKGFLFSCRRFFIFFGFTHFSRMNEANKWFDFYPKIRVLNFLFAFYL